MPFTPAPAGVERRPVDGVGAGEELVDRVGRAGEGDGRREPPVHRRADAAGAGVPPGRPPTSRHARGRSRGRRSTASAQSASSSAASSSNDGDEGLVGRHDHLVGGGRRARPRRSTGASASSARRRRRRCRRPRRATASERRAASGAAEAGHRLSRKAMTAARSRRRARGSGRGPARPRRRARGWPPRGCGPGRRAGSGCGRSRLDQADAPQRRRAPLLPARVEVGRPPPHRCRRARTAVGEPVAHVVEQQVGVGADHLVVERGDVGLAPVRSSPTWHDGAAELLEGLLAGRRCRRRRRRAGPARRGCACRR